VPPHSNHALPKQNHLHEAVHGWGDATRRPRFGAPGLPLSIDYRSFFSFLIVYRERGRVPIASAQHAI
jgi:hypothetical protein